LRILENSGGKILNKIGEDMKILRSFLFVPADKKKMLDKIPSLDPDAFILDLEDSVIQSKKDAARKNISSVLPALKKQGKMIFIRINEAGTKDSLKDLNETYSPLIEGYMVPKFEDMEKIKELITSLEKLEASGSGEKTGLILMVESPKGIIELRKLALSGDSMITRRLKGIALGGEDYLESITVSRQVSKQALGQAKDEIIIFSHSHGILAIDTVFPDFSDDEGLRYELGKEVSRGFTSKLAIHPSQVDIINRMFNPHKKDIEKMDTILSHKDEIESKGATSISGEMYDMPHLKWALKLKKYLDDTGGK
jgi:citrate lyase subunit beta/citryl-CoA lyase